jgi:hypothetical protein
MFENLQKVKTDRSRLQHPADPEQVKEILQKCYTSGKDKKKMPLLPLFQDQNNTMLIYTPKPDDYETMDILTDYFTEHLRLNCAIYAKDSPLDVWEKQNFSYVPLLREKGKVTAETLREYLYRERIIAECTQFKPTLFVTLIQFFQAKNVLDTSAGWGDRLIAALAANVSYTGIDPAPALHMCYKDKNETLK